jgi:hypothetical protein
MLRLLPGLGVALVIGLTAPAHAEVQTLTLGITLNCPYGLAG